MHKHMVVCFVLQLALRLTPVLCKIDPDADWPPQLSNQIISVNSNGNFQDDYRDSNEQDDNCIRLAPNAKRSAVSHENEISFTSLMNGGFDNMVNADNQHDVILIMGNTGVGKTVVTQMIAGDLSKIHAVYTHTGNLVIIDDAERISTPSVISRTLVPELVIKTDNLSSSVAFYDCPGFDDTRGPTQDVATSFFMNQIVKKVKRVKFLFLVLYSSVQLGHDRLDFDLMVQHATNFVKNVTVFRDSIGLVVTKVRNYGNTGEYLKDIKIKRKILEFLFAYNETLHYSLAQEDDQEKRIKLSEKIEFVNILLQKDYNGQFSKVAFSRDPEKCGKLSESQEVENTKKRIEKMYENLQFTDVGNSTTNFGFTLKSETTLKIATDYVPQLNNGIVQKVENVTENFKIWLDNVRLLEVGNYTTSLAHSVNKVVEEISNEIVNMLELKNNSSISSELFGLTLQNGFKQINYTLSQDFVKFTQNQETMFEFFENVVGSEKAERRINDWLSPLASLQTKILEYSSWYGFCAKLQDQVTSYDFQAKKLKKSSRIESWIDFIEMNQVISSNPNIKLLERKFGENSVQVRLLNDIMNYATVPAKLLCFDRNLVVTGHFVRFSEFIGKNRLLSPICNFDKLTKQIIIKVYASNIIFIDESVNAVGLEYNLVLIAPKCELVGRSHINLDGSLANNHNPLKAVDGSVGTNRIQIWNTWIDLGGPGTPGEDGLAGKPGGPGGSFFGVFSKIKDGDKLRISANGGNGGAGQIGGNGGRGSNGGNAGSADARTEGVAPIVVWNGVWKRHGGYSGQNGGRGGDGGVGGPGGNPGLVEIKWLEESSSFNVLEQVSTKVGNSGKMGIGGKGGTGGKHGDGIKCFQNWVLFIPVAEKCESWSVNEWASAGLSGVDNNSKRSFKRADPPNVKINKVESIANFKKIFASSLDYSARKFSEDLEAKVQP